MSINLYLIGLGFGDAKHVTEEAVETIESCNLILIGKKKDEKSEIADLKKNICKSFIKKNSAKVRDCLLYTSDAADE